MVKYQVFLCLSYVINYKIMPICAYKYNETAKSLLLNAVKFSSFALSAAKSSPIFISYIYPSKFSHLHSIATVRQESFMGINKIFGFF